MKKGFTLIELLIVIAIITILISGLIVAVNPLQRFAKARDDVRESHVHQIWEAVTRKYAFEQEWICDAGPLPQALTPDNSPDFQSIGTEEYNLFPCLMPDWLPNVLNDPKQGSEENSGYQIWQHPVTKRISISTLYAETKTIGIGIGPEEIIAVPVNFLHNWAWSENIGWISMNVVTGGGEEDYGVGIDEDGNLTGSAWNRGTETQAGGLGWLRFDAQPIVGENFPAPPLYSAKYDSETNKITGWARFCSGTVNNDCNSATRDDWDGWVLLGPIIVGTEDFGLTVDFSSDPAELIGWAYGSEPVGWISFNCRNTNGCAENDYKVLMEKTHP